MVSLESDYNRHNNLNSSTDCALSRVYDCQDKLKPPPVNLVRERLSKETVDGI